MFTHLRKDARDLRLAQTTDEFMVPDYCGRRNRFSSRGSSCDREVLRVKCELDGDGFVASTEREAENNRRSLCTVSIRRESDLGTVYV